MIKNKVSFLLCLVLSVTTAKAQTLSLQDAISIALKNNFDIRLRKNDVEITKNNATAANAKMLPKLTADFATDGSRQNTQQAPSMAPKK